MRWRHDSITARLFRRRVPLLVCGLGVGIAFVATALFEWRDQVRTLDAGRTTAATVAHVLAEQTARSFQAVDLTLTGIVDALRAAPSLSLHDAVFEETLRRKRDGLPHVRALFVIGADGFITQDTDHPYTPRVSLADRPYFEVHARDAEVGLHIERPLVSRSVDRWFVSMSRRIDTRDGRFGGIAVAAVEPQYFGRFYDLLRLSARDNITLFLAVGTLLARHPHNDAVIGRSFADSELFLRRLPAARDATYTAVSPVDGVERVASYRRLSDLPLVVLVGLDRDALLAPWRTRAVGAFVATVSIALLVCALGVVFARAARQRAAARERLAEAERLESLGRLAAGVAHDFGNVLFTIVASLHGARRFATDDKVGAVLDRALRSAKRGTELASQLLAFARKQPLKIEPVSVTELTSNLTDFLRDAASSWADVAFDLSADVWPCRLDRAQFGVALLNLTLNASQACSGRRGRIRLVTINVRVDEASPGNNPPPGQYVRVTVQDDAAGMPPEVVRRVTEPFYTTKSGGTGLGLSQVYGFVKQVGGEVTIDSQVGAGTSVHLFFPRDLAA